MTRPITRRRFLASTAAVTAAVPFVRSVSAAEPNEKVRLAVVGVCDRGAANLAGVTEAGSGTEIVALCDVDEPRAATARKQFPDARFFTDYRQMFDAVLNKVDAVVVSTPDHNHAYPGLIALKAGKHVYCEKPLAHTVEEVRRMQKAAADAKVITQMGTQIHAGDNYRRVVEIIQAGKLGDVKRVHVWLSRRPNPGKKIQPPVPMKFSTDLWLGPVPAEFFYARHTEHGGSWPHFNWRYWWEFGGGELEDFGCHYMDLPFWALGLPSPTRVEAVGTPIPDADNTVPNTLKVDYHFPTGVHLTWYHGVAGPDLDGHAKFDQFPNGVLFEGDKGKLVADYTKYRVLPDAYAKEFKAPDPSIPKSVGHHKEWLDAIRGQGKPLCHFGYAAPLAEAVLLGNVAYRAGKPLEWDAKAGQVTNAPGAMRFVRCETRKGWEFV